MMWIPERKRGEGFEQHSKSGAPELLTPVIIEKILCNCLKKSDGTASSITPAIFTEFLLF